jgi:DNA-binding NarL/FixJ family response regulator
MRVVIAEDQVLLRVGLGRLLEDEGFQIVASVGDGDALLRAVDETKPDVVVCDVRMPPTFTDEGLRAALVIRSQTPQIGVLVLSHYVEQTFAVDLIAQNSSGVGYLLKDRVGDVDEFIDAVRRVGDGGTALDPDVVSQLLIKSRRRDPLATLTPRELEVLQLMAEGRSNSAIATALFLSSSAVEKHVSNIFAKLGLPAAEPDHRRVLAVLRFLDS